MSDEDKDKTTIIALRIYKEAMEKLVEALTLRNTSLRTALSALCYIMRRNLDHPSEASIDTVKFAMEKIVQTYNLEKDLKLIADNFQAQEANPGLSRTH